MKKYFIAAIVSLIYIPFITIGAEMYTPLKDVLKNAFWHHWLGKSVILIVIFAFVVLAAAREKEESAQRDEKYFTAFIWIAAAGALSVFLFFTFEYFKHLT